MIKKVICGLLMGLATAAVFSFGIRGEYNFSAQAAGNNGDFSYKNVWISQNSIDSGKSIDIKAVTEGNSDGYSYKFVWSCNNWQSWGIVHGINNAASFTPIEPGEYQIFVDVTAPNGEVVTKSANVTVNRGWYPNITLSNNNSKSGETISISAKATGAFKAQYKYVWQKDNWDSWGVISDFSEKSSVGFRFAKEGSYEIIVDIKDGHGNIASAVKKVNVDKGWVPEISAGKNSIGIGETITISAAANGANGAQYKYVWQKDNWKSWGVISDFSTEKSTKFSAKTAGDYELIVDVKDSYGNIASKTKVINVGRGWIPEISTSKTSANTGEIITISAAAKGANGAQYKYVWQKDNWSSWGIISNFSEKSSVGFRALKAGNYELIVDVKDSYGNIASTKKTVQYKTDWNFTGISGISNNATVNKGSAVSLKANTSGNTSGLKYKFVWSYNNWDEWDVISNDTMANVSFAPEFAGRYDIFVDVYDSNGNVVTKSITFNTKNVGNATATKGQLDALARAKSYLEVMAFSKQGLIDQLKFEKFTDSEASYAAANCGANWNEQAVKKAQGYIKYLSYSKEQLISQLKFDGFTDAQARYGAQQTGVN